jgi:transcriptional regulator with XRE-family HTH domain
MSVCPTCNQELPVDELTFGGRLKRSRVLVGLTAKELGQKIGYKGGSQITRWEDGTAAMPDSIKVIKELADALQTEVLWLMMGATTKPEEQIEGQQVIEVPDVGVDWTGPVDRAGRPARYTDGSEIPVGLRPDAEDTPEGVVRKKG